MGIARSKGVDYIDQSRVDRAKVSTNSAPKRRKYLVAQVDTAMQQYTYI